MAITDLEPQEAAVPTARWGMREIESGVLYVWQSPTLRVFYRREGKTLATAFTQASSEDEFASTFVPPEDLAWTRHVLDTPFKRLQILPAFSDKPLLVKLDEPFVLQPGADTTFFVCVPVWIRFLERLGGERAIAEFPTARPEKAWFGASTTHGEVCCWHEISPILQPAGTKAKPFEVLCKVTIRNGSSTVLTLSNLYLRTAGLSIFEAGQRLWADSTAIAYSKTSAVSECKVSGKPPPIAYSARRLSPPREPHGLVHAAIIHTLDFFSRMTGGES